MPSRDLGFLALAAIVAVVVYLYARRRWRISVERAAEVKWLTWLAVEESAKAELESEALYYVAPLVNTVVIPSSLMEDGVKVNGGRELQCAVCFRHTRTRCSRCKAVRYCSGKCQIVHWRQGHKDNCHPPKVEQGENAEDTIPSLKVSQSIKPSPSEFSVATETVAHSQQPLEKTYTESLQINNSSSVEFSKDNNNVHPVVGRHETESTSDLPSDSSLTTSLSSKSSTMLFSKQSSASNDASSDKPHVPDSENASCTSDFPRVSTLKSDKLNVEKANISAVGLSCASEIEQNIQSSKTDEIKSRSGVSSESYLVGSDRMTRRHSPLVTASSKRDAQFSKQQSVTMDMGNTSYSANKSTDIWLLKEKSRCPAPSLLHVNNDFSNASTHAQYNYRLSRNDNVPAVHYKNDNLPGVFTKSAENISSIPNNISESVKRAVQHLKSSNLPKYSSGTRTDLSLKHNVMFPYELFVKLYTCDKVDIRPCGLTNCGNSCFANAVLQCLAFTRPLKSYLLQGYHAKTCPKEGWCFTCEFASLLVKAKQGQSPISPIGIISRIHNIGSNLGQGRQEDAHEFLRYAVDAMQMVCLKETGINVAGRSIEGATFIQMIFGGYLLSKIKCMRCRVTSERLEQMMDLTVEIQGDIGTLEEALARFTATETLDGENKYECGRCKSYERAKKKLTILEAPNVLTIALKRFQSGKFGKLNKPVRFPDGLDLSPYMSSRNDRPQEYSLYAVVVHQDIMNAAFSGHYICYVKTNQNKWYKTDDSKVKSVDIGRVLANNAYLLFYARCSPRPPSLHSQEKHKPSKLSRRQPFNFRSTNTKDNQNLPYQRSDVSSDSSSLFSFSDEGSCSTRDSTSTEELSDIFKKYSSSVLSEDSNFCPVSSPFSESEDSLDSSPQFLFSGNRKLAGDNCCKGSRETNVVLRRSNATRERR